jgi:oligopeptide/dipeptide ABC transporter ATP-binding protein
MHNNQTAIPRMEVKDLKKHYPIRGGRLLKALDGVSLKINTGDIFGIVGESGCGKSTLGKCMMRVVDITSGEVRFSGEDISRQNRKSILPTLKRMQMIFQNPYSSFNPKLKISYSLSEPCRLRGMSRLEINERIGEFMQHVSLTENELNRFPHELSGGQLQRLAIARALLLDPEFIVADEPVSALDVSVQAQILNLLVDLKKSFDLTVMFISHDMTVVEHVCSKVAVMYLGVIVEMGAAETVFANISHPYTQALISAIPTIDVTGEAKKRIVLGGDLPSAVNIPAGCRFASRCRECIDICMQESPQLKEIEPEHFVACHRR